MRFKSKFMDFAKDKYSIEEMNNSLFLFSKSPTLVRRLCNLYQSDPKGFADFASNPWYDEMKQLNISIKDITIITDYLKFEEKEKHKEFANYSSYLDENNNL